MKKIIPSWPILTTTTFNGIMCWTINQLPNKVDLGIPSPVIIVLTVVCVLGIVFASSQSTESQKNSTTISTRMWIFALFPTIGSIILFFLLKYGYLPSEFSQAVAYISLFLFTMGTVLPLAIVFWQVQQISSTPTIPSALDIPAIHSSEKLLPNSVRSRLEIILNAENFKPFEIQTILNDLRIRSRDNSLQIVGIEKGSIILTLEGSEQGITELEYLYKSGEISNVLGIGIRTLYRVDKAIKKTLQERSGISVSLYLESQKHVEKTLQEKLNIAAEERLFGIEENLDILKQYLEDKEGSWFISVTGEGGIGKTSISEKLVREYTSILGFEKLAWVTAKRIYLDSVAGETQDIGETLNVDSMIYQIAEQLDISLPATNEEQFPYFQDKLMSHPYLVVIDNLETLKDYEAFFGKLNTHGSGNNFKPSKIIFTSRVKVDRINNTNLELSGLSEKSSLGLIRYHGKDVDRINTAEDSQLLPIYSKSEGNPLLIKLILDLIKKHDSPLKEIFSILEKQDQVLDYLYGQALKSISHEALEVVYAMTSYAQSSGVSYKQLKATTDMKDGELKKAIHELVQHSSLLSRIPSKINQEASYSIHNLLYEYLKSNG